MTKEETCVAMALRRLAESPESGVFYNGRTITDADELEAAIRHDFAKALPRHLLGGVLPSSPSQSSTVDFERYLEPGEDDNSGRVREILVGPFREFDDRNDHEITPGNFLTEPEWDYVVGGARTEVMHLVGEIGFNPWPERPEDSKPRGESWLAERAAADAKAAEMERSIAELEAENAELKASVSARDAKAAEMAAEEMAVALATPDTASVPLGARSTVGVPDPDAAKGSGIETQPPAPSPKKSK